MGRPGLHRGMARTSFFNEEVSSRCHFSRTCPLVRRLCTSNSPSSSSIFSLSSPASRRHTPQIRAWSGGSAQQIPGIITSGTDRRLLATKSPRLRVAVDVDEVLGRFLFALNQFCKDRYGMEYGVSDYWIYEFAKIWNCSQEHSNHIVHEFFKSQHFTEGIPVIPGALEALTRLSEAQYELVVVTSRQHVIQDVTLDWLDRHYGGLFQEVYFGNHFALEGKSRKKSDICKTIGAKVLIDDNPSYAQECAAAGINVLLYDWDGAYPWSKLPASGVVNKELIRVVRDWGEVEQELALLAPQLQQGEEEQQDGS
ncbi:hypothetical protein Agub_g7369 [Astrephomene gubernaculifera]|uniref:Uncharacterized protein n=1 Tax=Astrephomene gubernaculifera TaxID=47775 RepID=A0AAD3DSP6_9CHLO|nr:hypothetical protein Agub_g7369 [Astrephomene gubernaculifera]